MKAKYEFNTDLKRAEIKVGNETLLMGEAADLIKSLADAMQFGFYDFTASTPNRASHADMRPLSHGE